MGKGFWRGLSGVFQDFDGDGEVSFEEDYLSFTLLDDAGEDNPIHQQKLEKERSRQAFGWFGFGRREK